MCCPCCSHILPWCTWTHWSRKNDFQTWEVGSWMQRKSVCLSWYCTCLCSLMLPLAVKHLWAFFSVSGQVNVDVPCSLEKSLRLHETRLLREIRLRQETGQWAWIALWRYGSCKTSVFMQLAKKVISCSAQVNGYIYINHTHIKQGAGLTISSWSRFSVSPKDTSTCGHEDRTVMSGWPVASWASAGPPFKCFFMISVEALGLDVGVRWQAP